MKSLFVIIIAVVTMIAISILLAGVKPVIAIVLIAGVLFCALILFGFIKPIWVIAAVFLFAPFYDLVRAMYFRDVPFLGVYQEIILLILLVSRILTIDKKITTLKINSVDYLVILLVIWNFFQIFHSPSMMGGFYVWRWYSVGPLTYLIFRLYSFSKRELIVILSSICIGLFAAAIYISYQYFFIGPEKVAQISRDLGFTAFYRIDWRLPGPFSSPLVASASYSILVLTGVALLSINKLKLIGFPLIILGSLSILMTLSRSGIAISAVGIIVILGSNFQKLKYKILPVLFGLLLGLQIAFLLPSTQPFVNYLVNTDLDSYDVDRINQFSHIINEATTKYPFGIGYAGGGAISIEAYSLFGGDSTYIPDPLYIGGDSVLLATLQTSGFLGMFLLVAVYLYFIGSSISLLIHDPTDYQKIIV